jgi:hypothetical protein
MRLAVVAVLFATACDVGSVLQEGGGLQPDASGGGGGSVDSGPSGPPPPGTLAITATSSPAGGPYNPSNIVAVWIEDSAGTFVKTIQRWSNTRTVSLLAWNAKSGGDTDAVSGATRTAHTTPLTIMWDLKNKAGTVVPDGTYTIRMEGCDANANDPTDNNQATFTFVKGTAPQTQTALTNDGFSNVSIEFTP